MFGSKLTIAADARGDGCELGPFPSAAEEKKLTSMEEWELPYSGLDGRCIEKSIGEYKYKI